MVDHGREVVELGSGPVGVISDIHGNAVALTAVLADAAPRGIRRWLVLGDVVAMGPEPAAVLDLVGGLDTVAIVRGNTDRYLVEGSVPPGAVEAVRADPDRIGDLVEVAMALGWTSGRLSAIDRLDELAGYRDRVRFVLPDGTRTLAVHASLDSDDGPGITPGLDRAGIEALFPDAGADLVFGGHTHHATDVRFGGVRYINPGSLSNHLTTERVAKYTVLHVHEYGHHIEHRTVAYDVDAAVQAIIDCGIPSADWLVATYFAPTNA